MTEKENIINELEQNNNSKKEEINKLKSSISNLEDKLTNLINKEKERSKSNYQIFELKEENEQKFIRLIIKKNEIYNNQEISYWNGIDNRYNIKSIIYIILIYCGFSLNEIGKNISNNIKSLYGKINETLYQFLSNIYYKYDLYEKLENFNYSKDIFVTLFKQSNINIPDNIIIKMRKLIIF